MTLPIPEFNSEGMNLRDCEDMIAYYRQRARELKHKLKTLRKGGYTIMCRTTLDTLDAILHVYLERITALAELIDQFNARTLRCQEINDSPLKKNSTNP
jgi:hypothetical protein